MDILLNLVIAVILVLHLLEVLDFLDFPVLKAKPVVVENLVILGIAGTVFLDIAVNPEFLGFPENLAGVEDRGGVEGPDTLEVA